MRIILKVWMYTFASLILAGAPKMAFPQEIVPAGMTEGVVSERQVAAPTQPIDQVLAPQFVVSFSGSETDYVRDAFQRYRTDIGQPVEIIAGWNNSRGYVVEISENTTPDRDIVAGVSQALQRYAHINGRVNGTEFCELTARIRLGNDYVGNPVMASSAQLSTRIAGEIWTQVTSAYVEVRKDPYTAARRHAAVNLVPALMAELQRDVIAKAQAARERESAAAAAPTYETGTRPAVKAGYEYEILTGGPGQHRYITTTRPLRMGQSIKVMRGSRVITTLVIHYFSIDGDQVYLLTEKSQACDPSTTLVPGA